MKTSKSIRAVAVTAVALAAISCTTERSPLSPETARRANTTSHEGASANAGLPTFEARPVRDAGFAQLNAMEIPISAKRAGYMMPVVGSPPGTLVRSLTVANPDNCSIQTGIAFDGTNLIMSCWYTQTLDLYNPSTGALVKRLSVPSVSGGFFALAWDGQQNRLWACADYEQVYLIDTSDPDGNGVVAPAEVSFKFTVPNNQQCIDGLAFDGSDQTLWASGDVSSTISHLSATGAELGNYPISPLLDNTGNSGIAAGGGKLYLANNGGSQIYVTNKPPTTSTLFATFPRRIEDLECDDRTFRDDGISVIWQQDAFDREIQAYAIEPNACPFGGFVVPQGVMDVQPGVVSVQNSATVNVILISNALFDASTINLANTRFVVNNNAAIGASINRRGAAYNTSVRDWNGDGRPDRLVVFTLAALRAAGLTAGATNIRVEDVTSATGTFQVFDSVLPSFVP